MPEAYGDSEKQFRVLDDVMSDAEVTFLLAEFCHVIERLQSRAGRRAWRRWQLAKSICTLSRRIVWRFVIAGTVAPNQARDVLAAFQRASRMLESVARKDKLAAEFQRALNERIAELELALSAEFEDPEVAFASGSVAKGTLA